MSLIQYIGSFFPNETPWRFTTSRGISGGVLVVAGGVGSLYVNHGDVGDNNPNAPDLELDYAIIGGSIGPLPGSLTYSTKDFFSMGVDRIFSNTKDPLTFDDMKGAICTVGLAGNAPTGTPDGMSAVIYFMGLPWSTVAFYTASSDMAGFVTHGLMGARAMGMMIGHYKGFDGGFSVQVGYAH